MGFLDDEITDEPSRTSLTGVLHLFGKELQERLVNSLAGEGLVDSNLAQSIRYTVTPTGEGGFRFELLFDDYGNYLDEGVQGKGGSRGVYEEVTSKNGNKYLKRKVDSNGKPVNTSWKTKGGGSRFKFNNKRPPLRSKDGDPTKSLEVWANTRGINKWAVQESIFRQGIKANHWFSDVIDGGIVNELTEALEQHGVKQIELDIVENLKGILNGKD